MARLSLAALCVAGIADAAPGDYTWEAGLSFERRSFDDIVIPDLPGFPGSGGTFEVPDSEFWQAYGVYHFQDVKTDDVPLAEAAYLGRVSSARLSWTRADFDSVELDAQQLGFELYVPKTMFYFAGGVARFESFESGGVNGVERGHDTDWYAAAGITPIDGLRITTFYGHETGYDPNVSVKYVGKLGSSGHFFGAGLRVADPDEGDTAVAANFDFYFDTTLRVGLGYEDAGGAWTFAAEKFFTPRFGVQATYETADGTDSATVRAAYRF